MTNGVDMVKDGLPPVAIATGVIANQASPSTVLQIIGATVGVIGIFATLWRCWEARRANNETASANKFNRMKWEHENASNATSTTTKTEAEKQQASGSGGKGKKTK